MTQKRDFVLIVIAAGCVWHTSSAHHGNYQFDTDTVVTLEGTVTGFEE